MHKHINRKEEMVSSMQRRIALRKKLHVLRTLASSKSVKRNCDVEDAVLCIYELTLKLEEIKRQLSDLGAVKREHVRLVQQVQSFPQREVKVQKAGKGFVVRVICEKGGDKLVGILEVFEKMGLMVLHARVSSDLYFCLEGIVVAEKQHSIPPDVNAITRQILEAIGRHVKGT